ncbi:MAG: UvrD-helicase domain-containing protein [Gemmatimonadota bacterium]|nr:UvrD-helicase domain-containing protein [Gemmatimonadota bacterium]MDH5758627.1 UvrD-helicase domain-containing protein [Gemmatimonadota bacterium]
MTEAPATLIHLNPEQRAAAEHFEGPLLVLAGAGSGKTRVLTSRVCHLIREHGVAPDRILAVTFTNKAAGEMRERITGMLGGEPRGIWVGTFHAIGARIMRRHAELLGWNRQFTIFDQEQTLRLVKKVEEGVGLDPKRWSPKAMRAEMSAAKNQLVTAEDFARDHEEGFDLFLKNVAKVFPAYQASLKEQNAFDFDDLLTRPVELFETFPHLLDQYRDRFSFLLVDEYQDTNHAQFRFLELLGSEHGNMMVVGDDDQSIYGWRGADIRNILDFEKTFPGARVVRLEENYRSTQRILDAANAVISENLNRKGKTLRTSRSGGELVTRAETFDETDEARFIVDEIKARLGEHPDLVRSSFAVLYRTNAQARALEDAFRRDGMPYQVVGGVRFYERREIQDLLAYLRIISNPLDGVAFDRVVNYPRRGVGGASLERLASWAAEQGVSLLDAALRAEEVPEVSSSARRGLGQFADLIQRFSARAALASVGVVLQELVEELDLVRHLQDEGPDGEDRVRNVNELVAGAMDFDAELVQSMEGEDLDRFTELDLFLQQVALVADVDRLDPDADTVTLMTLHNAKGLEFPVVFIAGLEDGLFPLGRAYDDPAVLEEERRLFYVGITRAEEKLVLTWARQRRRAGEFTYGRLSHFVESIPDELIEGRRSARLVGSAGSTPHRSFAERRRDTVAETAVFDPDPVVETGMNQDQPRLVKGERVVHPTFGSGSVAGISGFGKDLKVTVDFDTVGTKKLLVRYANLEKDWM